VKGSTCATLPDFPTKANLGNPHAYTPVGWNRNGYIRTGVDARWRCARPVGTAVGGSDMLRMLLPGVCRKKFLDCEKTKHLSLVRTFMRDMSQNQV